MNKRGFTLIEMLGCIALLGIVLCLGLYVSKENLSTSLLRLRKVSDNEVYESARNYVVEKNVSFNESGYACVKVSELVEYGYLAQMNDKKTEGKIVKVIRDNHTKVITNVNYVDLCE